MSRFSAEQTWLREQLEGLRAAGLWRGTRSIEESAGGCRADGREVLNLSGNDYLGLRFHPRLQQAVTKAVISSGIGSGASRLLSGTKPEHERCEEALRKWSGRHGLLFGSGYLANLALLGTLADRSSLVVLDRLSHASLIDAAILSRARIVRYRHNDVSSLESIVKRAREKSAVRRIVVVTESLFSMDGDIAPIAEIVAVCERYGAQLIVDEAHAVGVIGEAGRGVCVAAGVSERVPYRSATFSKALAGYGGLVLACREACELFVNAARPFIYDTALPPYMAAAAAEALALLQEMPRAGEELLEKSELFRRELRRRGVSVGGQAQIVPLLVGSSEDALRLAEELLAGGILAPAIRPPTVPAGTARLRFSLHNGLTREQVISAAEIIVKALESSGVQPLERV